MTKEEYGDFVLRYKGCGACFPMYHTLSRFEKMWFTAIQKDVESLEGQVARAFEVLADKRKQIEDLEAQIEKMKCCGNCQKLRGRFDSKTNINILYCSDPDMKQIEVGFQMCCCKWEIKEK